MPKTKAEKPAAAADEAPIQRPTRCRVLEYTTPEGDTIPAIVTQVIDAPDERLTSMHVHGFHPVYGGGHYVVGDVDGAARATAGEPGTWNWPPRV